MTDAEAIMERHVLRQRVAELEEENELLWQAVERLSDPPVRFVPQSDGDQSEQADSRD